jgi:hypothetical protein
MELGEGRNTRDVRSVFNISWIALAVLNQLGSKYFFYSCGLIMDEHKIKKVIG